MVDLEQIAVGRQFIIEIPEQYKYKSANLDREVLALSGKRVTVCSIVARDIRNGTIRFKIDEDKGHYVWNDLWIREIEYTIPDVSSAIVNEFFTTHEEEHYENNHP